MIFHIAVCAGDPALRAVLRRHCEDYFARRATGCAVACFDSPEALLEQVRKLSTQLQPFREVLITRAGSTISCHCGPNCLGVLFLKK